MSKEENKEYQIKCTDIHGEWHDYQHMTTSYLGLTPVVVIVCRKCGDVKALEIVEKPIK